MFTDNDLDQATQACSRLRNHVATIANAKPDDAWWGKRLAIVDQLVADLVAKRNAGS